MLTTLFSAHLAAAALALPSPVVAGDWPDPSVVALGGNGYAAVTTSEGWAPGIRVLRGDGLRNWRIVGSVLPRAPRWVKKNLWAPEISKRPGGGYAVYYSALQRKKGGWYCIGTATSKTLEGPWRDLGHPLRCGKQGSIDPTVVDAGKGRRYLLYKSDGNAFDRPAYLMAQRLSSSGKRVLGKPRKLIRNDRRWEGEVVEAPTVVRHGGFFYLLYSGNACCVRRCAYAVGVARSRTIIGRWKKFSGNPILRSGNGWRCPGHTTVTSSPGGSPVALFHAFREGAGRLAGRQVLAAPLTWKGGWPRIGSGKPPPATPVAPTTAFSDSFASLAPEWEWPLARPPGITTGAGLTLRAPGSSARLDGGILSRRIDRLGFDAVAVVDRDASSAGAAGGLSVYRPGFAGVGISAGRAGVTVWERTGKGLERLSTAPAIDSPRIYLRLIARGTRFAFEVSGDGSGWQQVGPSRRVGTDTSVRIALTSGGERGASVRFLSASVTDR